MQDQVVATPAPPETARPTNTDQSFIRIRHGKFVHSPWLVFRRFLKFASRSVNILKIKIKPEWVSARHQPSLHCNGKMQVSTFPI